MSASDGEDSTYKLDDFYKCKDAWCGCNALLFMVRKTKTKLCPSKLIQMIGAVTSREGPSCTPILENVKDEEGHFLKSIFERKDIVEDKQQEVLNNAKATFNDSKQEAGILSYRTDSCNHYVNIYKDDDGKIKILDENGSKTYIEQLHQVRDLKVLVLKCDETGVPEMNKTWSKCLDRHCKRELTTLSRPGNS